MSLTSSPVDSPSGSPILQAVASVSGEIVATLTPQRGITASTSSLVPPQSSSSKAMPRQDSNSSSRQGSSHSRTNSRGQSFEYKETLDAKSSLLADGSRIINQYKLQEIIGQGAYGTVHRATLTTDPEEEFAIKEFGKTRLRKTHRAANLRRPMARGRGRARGGFFANAQTRTDPADRDKGSGRGSDMAGAGVSGNGAAVESLSGADNVSRKEPGQPGQRAADEADPLSLIRHEIAILKKLHHEHVVQLYEVLDDPTKDGLYMVFEHCPDGRVIDVKLHQSVRPLDEGTARDYMGQILLGIEYLHSNDIVHRDIKPDNILLAGQGRTCKIVDFGVSEMFLKPGDDTLHKSAGSPAFMSPELCTAGHGDFHGKADDLWSLGVTLYCMVVGRLPFDKSQFLELYESIKSDEPQYPEHLSVSLVDLLKKLLQKDPKLRITNPEMRQHPWITDEGRKPLISTEENLKAVVTEVTDEDLESAICRIASVFTIARAVQRFKRAGSQRKSTGASDSSEPSFPIDTKHDFGLHTFSPMHIAADAVSEEPESIGDYAPSPQPRRRDQSISSRRVPDRLNSVSSVLALDVETSAAKRSVNDDEEVDGGATPGGWNVSTPVARKFPFHALRAADRTAALAAVKTEEEEPTKDIPGYFPHIENLNAVRELLEAAVVVEPGQEAFVGTAPTSESGDAPKLLPDEPTVKSPLKTDLPTPPGAADAFRLHSQGKSGSQDS